MFSRTLRSLLPAATFAAALFLSASAVTGAQSASDSFATGAVPTVPARITVKIDNAKRVTLAGTMHPLARPANDRGLVADSTPLNRIHVVLKHSEAQEAALKQLIGDLHNASSPSFHKWLTPDEFGRRFGPSEADLAAVQAWLTGQGFTVGKLNPGHQTLEISGSAGTFRKAFNAEIHRYRVNGETHFANAANPQIPAALAPVLGGFASLNNFHLKSYAKPLGEAAYDTTTRKVSPTWTTGNSNGLLFALSPADFAVQYDLPAASTGNTGAGQTIAIINESNIDVYLVNRYRSLFGLPANPPIVILDGQDPGIDGINNIDGPNFASVEAYLDVELAGAVAPNATIDLVVGADTELQDGLTLAAEHAVYTNLAPIMSVSFGACEVDQATGNQFFDSLWQQAAAQGITVIVSTGDSGSAGCDNGTQYAVKGQAVNGLASTPYNVAVGGTDFYYSAYNQGSNALATQLASYWNETPSNSTPTASILGVIPEQPWNNSQFGLDASSFYTSYNETTIAAGSGGASTCGLYSKSASGTVSCAPYPKPGWQTGAGVPADNARDLPDLSLFAANGSNYSFYPICATDADCQTAAPGSTVQIFGVGGTSASTPAFAGIMALVNQRYGRQGQADFTLYPLATQFPGSFHDVAVGSNSVPCALNNTSMAAVDCIPVSSPITVDDTTYGTATEGQIGTGTTPQYNAGPGYDLATGLGTIDASVLLNSWNKIAFAASTTTLTPSSTSFAHGTSVTVSGNVTGSGTPTGSVALMTDSPQLYAQAQTDFIVGSGGAYTGSLNSLPGGSYNIYGIYSGDGINAASASAKTAITVTPEASGVAFNVLSPSSSPITAGSAVDYGASLALSALIAPATQVSALQNCVFGTGTCPSFSAPSGSVVFKDNGTIVHTGSVDAVGEAEYNYAPGVGSHSATGAYAGDSSYNASQSSAVAFTVRKNTPTLSVSSYQDSNGNLVGGQQSILTVEIQNSAASSGLAAAPTGSVALTGTLPTGTPSSVTLTPGVDPKTNAPAGYATVTIPSGAAAKTYDITFAYSGDANYNTTSDSFGVPFASAGSGLTSTTTATASPSSTSPSKLAQITIVIAGQSGKAAPTGTVYIFDQSLGLGSVTLPSSSTSSVTITINLSSQDLFQGTNLLTIQYLGDSNYLPSDGTVTLKNPLTDFSLNPELTNVTIPSPGTSTDTIDLSSAQGFSGTVILACTASGGVTCSLSPASVSLTGGGTGTATVTLNGANVSTSGTYDVVITGTDSTGLYVHTVGLQVAATRASTTPDFTLNAASTVTSDVSGSSVTDTLSVTSLSGFSGAVALTCSAPAGATCSVTPAAVTPASGGTASSTLTLTGTASGSYTVTVTGTSGALVHTVAVVLTTSEPDFRISAGPASASGGAGVTDQISVTSLYGFSSAVNLTCSASSGASCSLSPTAVTPAGNGVATSTLSVTGAGTGSDTVTVTGISGSIAHSVTISIPVPGFTLTASTAPPVATQGGTTSSTITLTSTNGFTGAVALTCAVTTSPSGASDLPGCVLSPASVTLGVSGTSTLTISTTAQTTTSGIDRTPGFFARAGGAVLAVLLCFLIPTKRRMPALLAIALCSLMLGFATGCGGGGNSGGGGGGGGVLTGGTTTGSYTVTVTGTSGKLTETTTVSAVVN